MNTKEQIEEGIKSLEWLKFNIVGTEEPKKNTFEYATKVYLENAIELLKDLIEYTDIEEELGIELLTLFKALKNGIYAVVPDYEKPCIEFFENYKLYLDLYSKKIEIRDDSLASVVIKHYGKTWAVTKEELK